MYELFVGYRSIKKLLTLGQQPFTDTLFIKDLASTMDYQRFFTPNGDGSNDLWQFSGPRYTSTPRTPVFNYNQYGKLIYQLDSNSLDWDGQYRGTELPASDYWSVLDIGNNNYFKGNFSRNR